MAELGVVRGKTHKCSDLVGWYRGGFLGFDKNPQSECYTPFGRGNMSHMSEVLRAREWEIVIAR